MRHSWKNFLHSAVKKVFSEERSTQHWLNQRWAPLAALCWVRWINKYTDIKHNKIPFWTMLARTFLGTAWSQDRAFRAPADHQEGATGGPIDQPGPNEGQDGAFRAQNDPFRTVPRTPWPHENRHEIAPGIKHILLYRQKSARNSTRD